MRSKALHIISILLLAIGMITPAKAQSFPEGAEQPQSKIKILGNVYGGGDQAAVQGNTTVEINKGQFAGDIFGGGNGALNADGTVKSSADVGLHNADGKLVANTGETSVTVNGGEMFFDDDHPSNHNIYGGGNLACNIAGSTNVQMNVGMVTWFTFLSNQNAAIPAWYQWYDQAMNPNTQKTPIIALFGAGYGAHTDVAGNTNVNVNIPGTSDIHPADGTAFTHTELESIDQIIMRWMPDHRMVGQFVSAVHGGGYDGTVGAYDAETKSIKYDKTSYLSQTNVSIMGQPFIFHVYGGGLGSKTGADANDGVNSHVGAVYGAARVDIKGGIINGDVFGGGAGIAGQATIPNPFPGAMGGSTVNLPYTYAAQVMRETDVTIDGNSTVIFGNVYGGGDIANTGWYTTGARPTMTGHVEQKNTSLATLDYTTSLHLNGGNILGEVFGGGNGRKKSEVEQYKFIGAVIGSTNVEVNGSSIWGDIYGGGNTGCIYSCQTIAGTQGAIGRPMENGVLDGSTNVQVLRGKVARDIFGGGYGDDPDDGDETHASSADIYGNAFVFFQKADLEYEKYWKPREIATNETMGSWSEPTKEVTGLFLPQRSGYDAENDINYRNSESDITHNLYGGGNMACTIFGNTHVYMSGAPTAPVNFSSTDYYKECIANVAKPHFSVFGGGFGSLAKVGNNAYSDINLAMGTGLHSIIGGGMNGPVGGSCQVHVGNDPQSLVHHVYGGGYYAPCHDTELEITRGTILENVFGGSVMGNIWAENKDMTQVVTKTVIGLQSPGTGRHSAVTLEDEHGNKLREYAYADHKNQITIGGNVYGANDVSGTVNGVASLTIYGGTIKGDVFGAGNGDHIGYYVPNELRYDLGSHGADNYFVVDHSAEDGPKGNTYVGRPQTIGGVKLTLEGNTSDERVSVLGQVFGGGNSCTVGAWDKNLLAQYGSNPHLTRDDPAYFLGGGKIDMNLGSHISIGRTHAQLKAAADGTSYLIDGENVSGLYMGCSGRHLATENWAKSDNYYHHFFDAKTGQYWPGFAVYDDNGDLLTRSEGLQSFIAYMNNILVWSDNVSLNIKNQDQSDVEDIWLANFVGGGFRGSMKAKTAAGQFHYTLPRGVTVGHDVIGGAYNTDVVYRIFDTTDGHNYKEQDGHYVYKTTLESGWKSYDEDPENCAYHHVEYDDEGQIKDIVRFYYDGGMLSELPYGTAKSENTRINRILKEYTDNGGSDINKDFTGENRTSKVAFNQYKKSALVYLELDNKLEVEYVDGHVHGGNVFGGCFSSGRVEGDIWTDYRCFQEGQQANSPDFNLSDQNFNNAKYFEQNFSMMLFGAGYGANTNIQGSAYVRVLHQEVNPESPIPGMAYGYPRLYNVFGGSYEGKVEGNTNIYFNPGKYGYVAGAIYGGGCNGYVGGKTYLELAGGYIDEAYGGARNADIGGGTHIWAYDGRSRWWGEDVVHSNGSAMVERDAENAPLFIGKLYGGTDISGQLCTDELGKYNKENGYQPYYTAEYWPKELYVDGEKSKGMIYTDTYLQVGGITPSDQGFPIIGAIFAAGNGKNTKSFFGDQYTDNLLPNQQSTLMEVSDGNIVYAFGGGNNATVTRQNYILVRSHLDSKHDIEGFGGRMYDVMKKRILSVAVDCYDEKLVDGNAVLSLKNASIQRLFGGNNVATMAIQPKWSLQEGRINNVYSGGNMGDMTYYNPQGKPATENGLVGGKSGAIADDGSNSNYTPRGLSITIEHPKIHIGSLYGGCRLSDVVPGGYADDGVTPLMAEAFAESEDYYGATVNITDGYIENVYGGNDISGTVHFGTNVNISGAVSGNVYGSGNGFYLYKWDAEDQDITEHLLRDYDESASDKALCYTVPASAYFGGSGANDTQKLLAINAARPSVEKAFLNIAGLEHYPTDNSGNPKRVAYVKGNVFCGGNASTILGTDETKSFSKFKIGSYVTLNGVFMGSDGFAYTQNDEIARFAKLNGFEDMGAATDPAAFQVADDAAHNPILLNVYMMAVDMKSQPKDFNLNLPLKEAHIGTYCGGGNRGSMLVNKTVSLPFHHDIIIYDKIVAGCLDANVRYNQGGDIVTSWGGYTRAVDVAHNDGNGNTKMKLEIASQFVPLVMDVPADKLSKNGHDETFEEALAHDFLYDNRTEGVKYTFEEFNTLFEPTTPYLSQEEFEQNEGEDHQWKEAPGIYAPSCNIYGGCYQSGEIEGDIILNVHSNMLRYVNKEDLEKSIAQNIACFNVYGAGFGQNSHVWGNVHITMDRSIDQHIMGDPIAQSTLSSTLVQRLGGNEKFDIWSKAGIAALSAEAAATYPSYNNVFGGGRNGKLIGNATVEIRNGLVYTDVAGGCYASDLYGSTEVIVGYPKYYECQNSGIYTLDRGDKWNTEKLDVYGDKIVKQNVHYLKGDLVANNVYQQILASNGAASANFKAIDVTPANWDDVHIKIGKGVYGGGYSLANSTAASAGSVTTHKLISDDNTTLAGRKVDFDGRYGLEEGLKTAGYGGNSSIMVGDQENGTRDHIRISTLKATPVTIPANSSVNGKFVREEDGSYTHQGDELPKPGVQYYNLSGDGGIYGDGHLTFCEAFRAADVTRYGYADGTPQHPVLMNTFQRMDLLNINDCCLMLQGAQDFATDQIDATIYSITRVNELRMNSSIDPDVIFSQITSQNASQNAEGFNNNKVRNYLAFFNNVHYLGSIVTNDAFTDEQHSFHGADGVSVGDVTYKAKKTQFIEEYAGSNKEIVATAKFKQRNVGTARNAIGINNGYCLRIQNQEYVGAGDTKTSKTYYGPIVGVAEVKLLTLMEGEGGGYVYADNIHADENNFLNTSGNFVFPGIVNTDPSIGDQYIVDDCFLEHFGTPEDLTIKHGNLDEAHYWYVEGNKYFFNTTLTGFTYQDPLDFDLIENDPNIILSGMQKDSQLNVKKIEWLSQHRKGYACVLENEETNPEKIDDYEFDIQVGGIATDDWGSDMPRHSAGSDDSALTSGLKIQNDNLPQFNIHLQDKLDNSGDAKYINHLDEPELVKIYLMGQTLDANGNTQNYEYTITLNIVYLQGPTFEGGVVIDNCALPGEMIGFSSNGIKIKTPELMPVTAASWQILPLTEIDEHGVWKWDNNNGIVIPESMYSEDTDGFISGSIPALYKQNEYNIAYIFTAGGKNFPVMPKQTEDLKQKRMIVVHNYHRMKEVISRDLQIETMPVIPNRDPDTYHPSYAEAKLYIEDEADLRAFVTLLNSATPDNKKNLPVGLSGLDIILQHDIKLSSALPTINVPFKGIFHGDGYHIELNGKQSTFLGDKLNGKVYNLGLIGGTISIIDKNAANGIVNGGHTVNSYEYAESDDYRYGKVAYTLSHAFTPETDAKAYADYVATYYADGDYQYATADRAWSLRTDNPNYGHAETNHNPDHTHDLDRWSDEQKINIPLYDGNRMVADRTENVGIDIITYQGLSKAYANDYLFFGQHLDCDHADAFPMHINQVATGDADRSNGGNRVYEASGYYHSKVDQKYYYNKDAWALKTDLTAIDFSDYVGNNSGRTREGDAADSHPTTFSTLNVAGKHHPDTSAGITKNLLVYSWLPSTVSEQGPLTAGNYGDTQAEADILYHTIGSDSKIANFHLVDAECFNAPLAYDVTHRAWYERTPDRWRNVTGVNESYINPSAWDGICLPFTVEHVEASENKELSHFYGVVPATGINDRTLHHEYWLTGLTKAESKDKQIVATFYRPAKQSGEDVFADNRQVSYNYTYPANTYFTGLKDYTNYHDDLTDDNWARTDSEWYLYSHNFADYVYLSQSVPYLIAFPGNDFYEFSLQGTDYDTFKHTKSGDGQQVIYWSETAHIGISDDENKHSDVNGHRHQGTYQYVSASKSTDKVAYGLNNTGSAFDVNYGDISPFRTFMTTTSAIPQTRAIVISDGSWSEEIDEYPDAPEDELGADYLKIWADGREIVVETTKTRRLSLCRFDGVLVDVLDCEPGQNRFAQVNDGFFLVGRTKLLLK